MNQTDHHCLQDSAVDLNKNRTILQMNPISLEWSLIIQYALPDKIIITMSNQALIPEHKFALDAAINDAE